MTINGAAYGSRTEAGIALLDACADIADNNYTEIGSYRGFVLFTAFTGVQHILALKSAESYRVELGSDLRGNLVRIDNALADMPERLERRSFFMTSSRSWLDIIGLYSSAIFWNVDSAVT